MAILEIQIVGNAKKILDDRFKKGINTFIEPRRGGYIDIPNITMDETGHWDIEKLKMIMDLSPGLFKQEYTAEFKKPKKTNPIGEWCDKWVKDERAKRKV